MKPPIRDSKGRHGIVGPVDVDHSYIEQIDRAENEGMTALSETLSAKRSSTQHPAETTMLERRVLAHERILQSLIAHMSETDSVFLERLQNTFCNQIKFHEQDYTNTEEFAEEFVHAIENSIQLQQTEFIAKADRGHRMPKDQQNKNFTKTDPKPAGYQIRNRNGIWEVTKDGRFVGDYVREAQARNAVRNAGQNRHTNT
jgi:hypothetical protein